MLLLFDSQINLYNENFILKQLEYYSIINKIKKRGTIMEKVVDFNKSVFELTKEYPEIVDILSNLGFSDITKPGMLNTAGRFMTIPRGAKMKNIDMEKIIKAFSDKSYKVIL